MAIVFTCGCGKVMEADDELAGRPARCTACGREFVIPGGGTIASPPRRQVTPPDLPYARITPMVRPPATPPTEALIDETMSVLW